MFDLLKKIDKKDKIKTKGIHIISICDIKDGRSKRLEYLLEQTRIKRDFLIKTGQNTRERMHDLWIEYNWYLKQLHKRYLKQQFAIENITTTVGRSVLAQRLVNVTTYTGIVNYCALGSSGAAPAVGNTTLGTETYRKALSPSTYSNNIAYLETFFSSAETSGNFEEYGFFIDGTGVANSGQLFNRFIQSITKSVTESLNVQSVITINDA